MAKLTSPLSVLVAAGSGTYYAGPGAMDRLVGDLDANRAALAELTVRQRAGARYVFFILEGEPEGYFVNEFNEDHATHQIMRVVNAEEVEDYELAEEEAADGPTGDATDN